MVEHCADIQSDRKLGTYWEKAFCDLAAWYGFIFTPMQIGLSKSAQAWGKAQSKWRNYTLPDITIWTAPGQHHEIKHKSPTRYGSYGLESYRFKHLLEFAETTQQDVLYTIHNHALNGGQYSKLNDIHHWFTANVLDLDGKWTVSGTHSNSYYANGVTTPRIYYWSTELWVPLQEYWQVCALEVVH